VSSLTLRSPSNGHGGAHNSRSARNSVRQDRVQKGLVGGCKKILPAVHLLGIFTHKNQLMCDSDTENEINVRNEGPSQTPCNFKACVLNDMYRHRSELDLVIQQASQVIIPIDVYFAIDIGELCCRSIAYLNPGLSLVSKCLASHHRPATTQNPKITAKHSR
jgi:hypothetical protein